MPKKKVLGCSFPVFIVLAVIIFAILILGLLSGPIGQTLIPGLKFPHWLVVPQPVVSLPPEAIFHIGSFAVTNTIFSAWLTIIFLVAFVGLVFRKSKLIPGRLQSLAEWVLSWLLNLCESVAGEKNGRKFFPVVATIFLYVIVNSWMSLLPFFNAIVVHTSEGDVPLFRNASTDANLTLSLALVSFIFVTYFGIRLAKSSFLKTFFNFGPFFHSLKDIFTGKVKSGFSGLMLGVVTIFVGLIELLTYFIRIMSFTFRLFGNMTAGELLLGIIMFLVPFFVAPFFYGLELIIGFAQAFIFGGLTLVFASMAMASHEEEHAT